MAYQENLEFYFNLSRRELRGLCKMHNLPANRSNAQLAKSLASFLRKENATSSKERSSVPESDAKETAYPVEETTKRACEKSNSSRIDSCGLSSGINMQQSDYQLHSHPGNRLEGSGHLIGQTSEKAYNTAANVVCPYPFNNGTKEGFGSSMSEPSDMGTGPQAAAEIQDITTLSQLHCDNNYVASKNGSRKSSELKSWGQKLPTHAVTNTGTSNMTLLPSGHKRSGDHSRGTRFVSSVETPPKAPPSLQFFVMSEEGINLYIDLNSSPSEWINSLKDELCIHPKAQNQDSEALPTHIRGLADADERMKISLPGSTGMSLQSSGMENTGGTGMSLQSSGMENTGCINSSSSSVVSENCQSEACPPDATVVTSRDSVLTSSSIPVDISGFLERNQVVSSSCVTNSDVYDHMASNIASCPRDEQVLHQNSNDASFRIDKSSSSVPDISLKSVGDVDMSVDGNRKPETDEYCTLRIASDDFNNVEPNALDNTLNSICRKSSFPIIADGIQDNMGASYTGCSENQSGACEVPTERKHVEILPEAICRLKMLSNTSQIDGQMVLDHPMTDAQSGVESTDHLSNQYACGNLGNSVPDDMMSAFGDELGRCTPMKGKNNSECSQFQNILDKHSQRSYNPESAEEFQSKRQHVCGETSGMMSSRSSKSSAKETPCDHVVVPRRSTRLVSKWLEVLLLLASISNFPWTAADNLSCMPTSSKVYRPHRVTVTEFGAVGDGATLNTKAFQNAIFYLHSFADKGGAQLFVPAGRWLTGSFNLISHLTLCLDKDAVIIGSTDSSSWPVIDPLPSYGRGRELPGGRHKSLIHGSNLTDVIITGDNGTIDGQGSIWWDWFHNKTLNFTRPHLVELMYSTKVVISNLTFIDSPFWAIHPAYCSNVLVRNVTILAPLDSPNTDGIDPDSSNNVRIEDCYISTGDDLIAVKSGWDEYGISFAHPSSNISIRHITGETKSGAGIAFGSEMSGGVSEVWAEDIHLFNSKHGIRIKTSPGRGGYIQNIYISDVIMKNVDIAIRIQGQYGEHPDEKYDPNALPVINRITIKNVAGANIRLAGLLEGIHGDNFSNICLSNIILNVTSPHPWNCSYVEGYSNMVSPESCEPLKEIPEDSSICYPDNHFKAQRSNAIRLFSPFIKFITM